MLEAKSRQRRHPSSYVATGAGRLLAMEANRGGGAAYLARSTTSAGHLRAGGQIRAAARHPLPDPDEVAVLGAKSGRQRGIPCRRWRRLEHMHAPTLTARVVVSNRVWCIEGTTTVVEWRGERRARLEVGPYPPGLEAGAACGVERRLATWRAQGGWRLGADLGFFRVRGERIPHAAASSSSSE